MYQFDKIKLIIWDLDETFWNGTISEGSIVVPEVNRQLILDLTDAGIINSICSKNDFSVAMKQLEAEGLSEYFVFPSIDWNSKGKRIYDLITDMQLRPANVLFIDDNPSNLGEAKHFCPDIMIETPEIISRLIDDVKNSAKKDKEHKRLQQYKVLEKKKIAKNDSSSNEEFLKQSNIKVEIKKDCKENLERIHDLVLRSNQLNFTKIRSTKEELSLLFDDENVSCGYVTVKDNFGDYGITGFFAVKDDELIHFVFSCRTLGMGIEQYVYNILHRPTLNIQGEVISDLTSNDIPIWINQASDTSSAEQMEIQKLDKHQVLIKGPCDLFQIYPYIANTDLFDTEFTYVTEKGFTIESTGHTTHIVEAHRLSNSEKERIIADVPFTHMGMYNDGIFKNNYKVVIISILADANLGVYRNKNTGEHLAIMEYVHPLTDDSNWDNIISGKYPNSGFNFTKEILKDFSDKYEFIGRNSPDQIVENLNYIRENLNDNCVLAIMLGGELYYEKNTFEAYKDRHLVHKEINTKIRAWASNRSNVELIDVNRYLVDQNSFYDHFNHYIKPVYYKLAVDIVNVINRAIDGSVKNTSKLKIYMIKAKELLAPLYHKIRKFFNEK